MPKQQLRNIALEVADKIRYVDPSDEVEANLLGEFALAFLAAVQEKAEPVAWMLHAGKTDKVVVEITNNADRAARHDASWPLMEMVTPLFTHPSFEQQTIPALLFEAYDYGQFADDFNQPLAKPIRAAIRGMFDHFEQRNGGQPTVKTDSQESPAVERCAAHPTKAEALEALDTLDDFCRTETSIDPYGPREALKAFIEATEPAPQNEQKATGDYGLTGSCSVGAAPLPDDVKAMVERLRDKYDTEDYRQDAAEILEAQAEKISEWESIYATLCFEKAELAANRVPEGMVLVPREPTEAMYKAFDSAITFYEGSVEDAYKAMIAAGEVKP